MSALVQIRMGRGDAVRKIQVTDRACTELRRLGLGGRKFMRIGVTSGGCAGRTYVATLDDEPAPNDQVLFDAGDVRIFTDRGQADQVTGLHIDYSQDLVASGFRLTNANAKRACGCGASFSL
ncbi:MAG: iron-sulfur cluster assembly accessory protein [Polyangiaceae bacterium]|nr:iron-sulfur cluster assembly accessory protein [Polyangiaceae bacterium]